MGRAAISGLESRAADAAVGLAALSVLAYAFTFRHVLLGLIVSGVLVTVHLAYTRGGAREAAGVFVVDVAFLLLLSVLGIIG